MFSLHSACVSKIRQDAQCVCVSVLNKEEGGGGGGENIIQINILVIASGRKCMLPRVCADRRYINGMIQSFND